MPPILFSLGPPLTHPLTIHPLLDVSGRIRADLSHFPTLLSTPYFHSICVRIGSECEDNTKYGAVKVLCVRFGAFGGGTKKSETIRKSRMPGRTAPTIPPKARKRWNGARPRVAPPQAPPEAENAYPPVTPSL